MKVSVAGRVLPDPVSISQPYFDAAKKGDLLLQQCPRDGFFFYPRNRCPVCLKDDWKWQLCSKKGKIYSYTVDRVGIDPANRQRVPLVIVLVDLEAGPRLLGNLMNCPLDSSPLDSNPLDSGPLDSSLTGMAVEACFEHIEGLAVLQFSLVTIFE